MTRPPLAATTRKGGSDIAGPAWHTRQLAPGLAITNILIPPATPAQERPRAVAAPSA